MRERPRHQTPKATVESKLDLTEIGQDAAQSTGTPGSVLWLLGALVKLGRATHSR